MSGMRVCGGKCCGQVICALLNVREFQLNTSGDMLARTHSFPQRQLSNLTSCKFFIWGQQAVILVDTLPLGLAV